MTTHRAPRGAFLARNPFPHPLTLGFFYREKMRAIHRVAPERVARDRRPPGRAVADVLEVGGGRSGLAALLYPHARVTNLDLDASYAEAPCNQQERVRFICGDATDLPFAEASFDVVTMFDLLEHVPEDGQAVREAVRVLRPGGHLLVSTPHARWRYPYYRALRPVCPSEEELFAEWGHVRRGYTVEELRALIPLPLQRVATFINPVTALAHDISFSKLPHRVRRGLCALLAPLTWAAYALHGPTTRGTETASCWVKAAPPSAGDRPAR